MEEKDIERGQPAEESRPEVHRPVSGGGSTTEADEKPAVQRPKKTSEDDDASDHGEPDIDHDEIEETVPGHELDVQLSRVSSPRISVLYWHRLSADSSVGARHRKPTTN